MIQASLRQHRPSPHGLVGLHALEELQQLSHTQHHFRLGSLQVKALQHRQRDVAFEAFVDVPAEDAQQFLLRNGFGGVALQLRHQLFALGEDAAPDVLVGGAARLLELAEGRLERDHAEGLRSSGVLVVRHPLAAVPLHDVARQLHRLCPLQPQRLLGEDVGEPAAFELLLVEEVGEGEAGVEVVGEGEEGEFQVLELDGRVQFEAGGVGGQLLLPALLLVFGFDEAGVFAFAVELLAKFLEEFAEAVVVDAEVGLLLVLAGLLGLVELFCPAELFAVGVEGVVIELQLVEAVLEGLVGAAQGLQLLVLLLLLVAGELLRLLEDHVLVVVGHGLDLGVLGSEGGPEEVCLAAGVGDLAFLEGLAGLEEVLVVLVEADDGLELLVLLLVELDELVLDAFVVGRQGGEGGLEADGLLDEVVLLDAGLLEDADVGQLLELLDLLLGGEVELVELLDLLLEDVGVDGLPPPLLLLPHPRLPLLLDALQELHLALVLAQPEPEVGHVLPLLPQLRLQRLVLLHQRLVVLLLEARVVLAGLSGEFLLVGGIEQFFEDVLGGEVEVVDGAELVVAGWEGAYMAASLWRAGGSLWRERLFFEGVRLIIIENYRAHSPLSYYHQQAPNTMSLDKFFNMKPRPNHERMEVENPERDAALPWVEKYRPNKLEEITYQDEVTSSLRNVLKTGNLPHLLFYGPAGTGKTSAIIALSKELFGPRFYKERVLELNASDERGIGVIREKVKKFAQLMCVKSNDRTYPCPNFKIIVLDEADLMTNDAQSALRRVIEDNSATTRFCIICNYITKIIEPLSSRCVKFRFKPIPLQAQVTKLTQICQNEQVQLQQRQLAALLEKGDLRQSINSLQSFHRLATIPQHLLPLSEDFGSELMNKLTRCSDIKEVYQMGQELAYEGYASDEVLKVLSRVILEKETNQRKMAIMLEVLSKAEESLLLGATELPLIEVITSLYYVINLHL